MNNKIFLCVKIDHETVKTFLEIYTRMKNSNTNKINIFVCSEGGDPYCAIGIYDILKTSQMYITTIGIGEVSSSAAIILLSGKKRLITENSIIMIHNATMELTDAVEHEMSNELSQFKCINNKIKKIITENTEIPPKELNTVFKTTKNYYIDSNKALKYKFIHEIYRR
jgi:ATP-dependent protease ClpP protease subunit